MDFTQLNFVPHMELDEILTRTVVPPVVVHGCCQRNKVTGADSQNLTLLLLNPTEWAEPILPIFYSSILYYKVKPIHIGYNLYTISLGNCMEAMNRSSMIRSMLI